MAKAALVDYLDGKAVDYIEKALEYFTWLVLLLLLLFIMFIFLVTIIKPNVENHTVFIV